MHFKQVGADYIYKILSNLKINNATVYDNTTMNILTRYVSANIVSHFIKDLKIYAFRNILFVED